MQLKTVSSFGLAFLLVLGVVGVASAQDVADPQGVAIRVDAPAANSWAIIGDMVTIRILTYDGYLDTGFRVSVRNSDVEDDPTAALTEGVHFNISVADNSTNTGIDDPLTEDDPATPAVENDERIIDSNGGNGASAEGSIAITTYTVRKAVGAGIDTFTISFPIPDGGTTGSRTVNNAAVKVVVDTDDALSGGGALNNLMTDKKITPATTGFGASRVGDGVSFGFDNDRPDIAGVFNKIVLDVAMADFDTAANQTPRQIQNVRLKVGSEVKLSVELDRPEFIAADASKIEIGIPEGTPAAPDSAFSTAPIMFSIVGDRLYESTDVIKLEDVVEEGDYADVQPVRLQAVLVDDAGNRSDSVSVLANATQLAGDNADGSAAFAVNWTLTIDGTSPGITWTYPHPDSLNETRITPKASGSKTLSNNVSHAMSLNPVKFAVSEIIDSILVMHGDNMRGFGRMQNADGTGDATDLNGAVIGAAEDDSTFTAVLDTLYTSYDDDAETIVYDAAAGTLGDLTIKVWDTYGNMTEVTNDAIIHDGVAPTVSSLFPTAENAPKNADNNDAPTINLTTKDLSFSIDEELDSLHVRYTESGGSRFIEQSFGSGNVRLETVGSLVSWPVSDTSFVERQGYTLDVLAIDLAGNASVTGSEGVLTFTKGFGNPNADMFEIAVATDAAMHYAGMDVTLNLTVIDTMLTRVEESPVLAVTYHTPSAIAVIVSGDQAGALDGVTFGGAGVSAAPSFALPAELAAAGMVAKAAILDGDGWHAGRRDVTVQSTMPISGATIMAAEGSIDPATGSYMLRISGQAADPVSIDAAEFSQFVVTAMEGEVSGGNVAGAFNINVLPADAHGNASAKIDNAVGSDTYASVDVNFSTSNAAVTVPSGAQTVAAGGSDFGAVAANITGSATIVVRTVASDYTTGEDANQQLSGSVTVNIVSEDGPGPDPGAPAAPANIVVQDYMGADGQGDQGGIVVISFPNSSHHEAVSAYQISREIDSTTGMDDEGNMIELDEPVKKWVAWTSVSFSADSGDEMGDPEGDSQTVIVPAIDNVATNWGVTAVAGGGESGMTTASKRVFTKESIRQTLQLLGMAPEAELLTDEELSNQFNAPEDYVKALIGDRKNVIFAPVNPDVSALIGSAAVPANIRTDGHPTAGSILSSARTVTEEPVAAVDNIAPASVTDLTGDGQGGVVLRWTASASDGVVGAIPYRGYNIPIMGVKGYAVMRGASSDALEMVAMLAPGSTQFTDDNLPDGVTTLVYRIDAVDDNNAAMSAAITITDIAVRVKFADANGDPVYLMVLPAQGGNLTVDFEDFVAFAAAFNSQKGDANYNPQADVDDDGVVDFSDYVAVAASFGRTAAMPAGSKLAVVPQRPGVNADTEMKLELASEKVLVGETISLTVSMANARQLNGFGLELTYDADKFEFVSAAPADEDLLKSEAARRRCSRTGRKRAGSRWSTPLSSRDR